MTVSYGNPPYRRVLSNHNRLLKLYAQCIGVKTGYTSSAGRCLIVTAEKNNLNLLAIVLGCQTTEDENGEYVLHSFPEAKALFEYGFDHFDYATVLSPLVPIA